MWLTITSERIMATAKTSRSSHFIFETRKGEMMLHVKRHSDDFACGRWVYVDDGLNHKYARFNGEILEIKGTSITVPFYDVGLDEDNSICLVPLRFTFPKRNLTLLPDMNTKTYFRRWSNPLMT
jgi:hypothetical protein